MASAESTALRFTELGYAVSTSQSSSGSAVTIESRPDGRPVALTVHFDRGAPGIKPRAQWLPDNQSTQFKDADTDTIDLVDAIIETL